MGKLAQSNLGDVAVIKSKLTNLDSQTHKLLELEVWYANILEKTANFHNDMQPAAAPRNVVRNLKARCCHSIAIGSGDPLTWTTSCTWEYAH